MGMLISDVRAIEPIEGAEGTLIRQILHPHNTMLGIRYSIAHCRLEPGAKSKPHKLKSSEVYFVIKGKGTIYVDAESADITEGQAVYVPPHSKQHIENPSDTPLEFLCMVDPAWRQEDEIYD